MCRGVAMPSRTSLDNKCLIIGNCIFLFQISTLSSALIRVWRLHTIENPNQLVKEITVKLRDTFNPIQKCISITIFSNATFQQQKLLNPLNHTTRHLSLFLKPAVLKKEIPIRNTDWSNPAFVLCLHFDFPLIIGRLKTHNKVWRNDSDFLLCEDAKRELDQNWMC